MSGLRRRSSVPIAGSARLDITRCSTGAELPRRWKGRGSKGYVLRQRLDSVMQHAVAHKYRQDNPAAELKVLLPKVKREPDHHPSLPHKRVADAVRAVRAADDVDEAVRLLLVFIVLTACRFNEAAGATWSEIDCESGLWTVPKERMKNGREHRVPLSRQALWILDLCRGLGRSDSLVFAVRKGRVARKVLPYSTFQPVLFALDAAGDYAPNGCGSKRGKRAAPPRSSSTIPGVTRSIADGDGTNRTSPA